jgi:hypothetical protein
VRFFMENTLGPSEHEKQYVDVSCPGRSGMHYVTHRSQRLQKHKICVTCPGALFMEYALGPPEREKWSVDISRPGRTGMHYDTRISHWMQKHKFGIMCLCALFVKSVPVPSEHENSASTFHARRHRNALRDP